MAHNEPSNAEKASSGSENAFTPQDQKKYADIIEKYPAITKGLPLPAGHFYKLNSDQNPLVIDDDYYIQPPVFLWPLDHSEDEPPWDAPILLEINQVSAEQGSDSESTISYESTTTTDTSDGKFIVDDDANDVFLHNHDPDFEPGSDSRRQDDNCAQVDEADSADDNADADEESDDDSSDRSHLAKKIRRESAGF